MKSDDCSICLESLSTQTTLQLTCGHTFHAQCVCGWFNTGALTCPTCRLGYIEKPPSPPPIQSQRWIIPLRSIPIILLRLYNAYVCWYTLLWSSHLVPSVYQLLLDFVQFQSPGDWLMIRQFMNVSMSQSYDWPYDTLLLLIRLVMIAYRGNSLFNATRLVFEQPSLMAVIWFVTSFFV